jgi:hypothetical protein
MANNAAEKRFWTWTFAELEVYFGIRRGGTSYYLKRRDFHPEILGVVNPKQLVETQNHPGFVPVVMGEDGKRPITRTVERMLGGIPWMVMDKAVKALDASDKERGGEVYRTFMAVQRRSPLDTLDGIAKRLDIGVATLYRHLRHALDFVDWYLDKERAGWPEGAEVS